MQLTQFFAERQQCQWGQLEVLFGKGDADDRNGQDQPANDVCQRNFPAKEDRPTHIERGFQAAS